MFSMIRPARLHTPEPGHPHKPQAGQAGGRRQRCSVCGSLTRQRSLLCPLPHIDDSGDELEAVAGGRAVKLALVVHEPLHQFQRCLVGHLFRRQGKGRRGSRATLRGGLTTASASGVVCRQLRRHGCGWRVLRAAAPKPTTACLCSHLPCQNIATPVCAKHCTPCPCIAHLAGLPALGQRKVIH